MKKIFLSSITFIGMLLLTNVAVMAQSTDFTKFGINSGISSLNLNPANQPGGKKGFVTILDAGSSILLPNSYNNLVQKNEAGKDVIIVEDLIQAIGMKPLNAIAHAGLGAGFHTNVGYFNFQISVQEHLFTKMDTGLSQLLAEGNEHLIGMSQSLGGVQIKSMLYSEFNIGYSRKFLSEKLTIGARLKLLGGQVGASTLQSDIHYLSTAQSDLIEIESTQKLGLSSIVQYEKDEEGNIMLDHIKLKDNLQVKDFMPKNIGVGFDLGAIYEISDKLSVSGAISDLGFIKWTKEINTLESNLTGDNKLIYKGAKMNLETGSKKINTDTSDISDLQDQLLDSFHETETTAFTTALNSRMHVAAKYSPYSWLSVVGALGGNLYVNTFAPWGSLVGTLHKGDVLACSVSLNTMRYAPLGIGLGFRLGPISIISDNILSLKYLNTRYANVHIGFTFDF